MFNRYKTRQQRLAAVISALLFVVILTGIRPYVWTLSDKVLAFADAPYDKAFTSVSGLISKLEEVSEKKLSKEQREIDDIAEQIPEFSGLVYITSKNANIRSTSDVESDNVIGETHEGIYFPYFQTEKGGKTTWYRILLHEEEHSSGWISDLTLSKAADLDEGLSESEAEKLSNFMEAYVSTSIEALKQEDFSIVEPYLNPNGEKYNEQKQYLQYLINEGIQEELLAMDTVNHFYINPSAIWVQTIEIFEITRSNGDSEQKKFISEYIVTGADQENYTIKRLVGTYIQN